MLYRIICAISYPVKYKMKKKAKNFRMLPQGHSEGCGNTLETLSKGNGKGSKGGAYRVSGQTAQTIVQTIRTDNRTGQLSCPFVWSTLPYPTIPKEEETNTPRNTQTAQMRPETPAKARVQTIVPDIYPVFRKK